ARSLERVDFGELISGSVARDRKPIVVAHAQESEDPRARVVRSLGLRVYACNPLLCGDRLLGTLSFGSRRRDRFGEDELGFLETISHYLAIACERTRLLEQLREDDRRKDEFLALLAHELRNPLAPIRNSLHVVKLSAVREEREKA